jgi:hypothetical protein
MEALSQLARDFERTVQIMNATPVSAIHATYVPPPNKNITNCYFLLTAVPNYNYTTSCTTITQGFCPDFNSALANQISLMSLSKSMFEGTKPMQGSELKSLYKAMKKQRNSNINSLL